MLWALGSYCLVVTHCFICPNVQLPMINYQSNLFSFSCIIQINKAMDERHKLRWFLSSELRFIQWIAVSMHLSFDQWEPSGLQSKWNCMAPFSKCTPPPPPLQPSMSFNFYNRRYLRLIKFRFYFYWQTNDPDPVIWVVSICFFNSENIQCIAIYIFLIKGQELGIAVAWKDLV